MMQEAVERVEGIITELNAGNKKNALEGFRGLAEIMAQSIDNEKLWTEEELRQFNGLMKYILLGIENGDFEFAVNTAQSGLQSLLKKVAQREALEEGRIDLKGSDNISRAVQKQYTQYMYPDKWKGVVPEHIKETAREGRLLREALYNLDYLQHVAFRSFIPYDQLKVLIAGCGTGEAAILCALAYPQAQFVAVDISTASLGRAMAYVQELGVKNIELRHEDLMTMELGQKFDMAISTGVIHHLSEPAKGVANIKKHLKEHGVLAGMVYGEYGRFEIGLFQDVLKIITGEQNDFDLGIKSAKILLKEVNSANRIANIQWKQDTLKGDNHIVDLLLNVNENRYNVQTLNQMLVDGGMRILEFPNKDLMNPERYVQSQELKKIFRRLSYLERCSIAEKINGKMSKLNFVAVQAEYKQNMPKLEDSKYLDYYVYKNPFLRIITMSTDKDVHYYLNMHNASLYEEETEEKKIRIDARTFQVFNLANGKNRVRDIFKKVGVLDNNAARESLKQLLDNKYLFLHN